MEICRELSNEPERTIADLEKKVSIEGGYVGESARTALPDLVFTGSRVHLS